MCAGEAAPAVTSCKAAARSLQLLGKARCPSSKGTAKTLSLICHLPHPCRGGREAQDSSITHRYQQQVHNTSLSSLLSTSSCSVCVCCCTKPTASCIKPKGSSTKHNPEALCCLAPIQKGSQLQSFNLPSVLSPQVIIDPNFYLVFNCFCKAYPTKARQQASVKHDYFWEHWGNLRCFSSLFGCKNIFQMFRNRKEKRNPAQTHVCMYEKQCMKNNEMA